MTQHIPNFRSFYAHVIMTSHYQHGYG